MRNVSHMLRFAQFSLRVGDPQCSCALKKCEYSYCGLSGVNRELVTMLNITHVSPYVSGKNGAMSQLCYLKSVQKFQCYHRHVATTLNTHQDFIESGEPVLLFLCRLSRLCPSFPSCLSECFTQERERRKKQEAVSLTPNIYAHCT